MQRQARSPRREQHRRPERPLARRHRVVHPPGVPDEREVVVRARPWNDPRRIAQDRQHPDDRHDCEGGSRERVPECPRHPSIMSHRAAGRRTGAGIPYTPGMLRTRAVLATFMTILTGSAAALLSASVPAARSQGAGTLPSAPAFFNEMRWRHIGPFRGGRTKAASGVPGQPNVFYIAATNGGVWKTTDYGTVWKPIFDDQPTGSVGALAVAPSDPNIIYVGSGEGLQRPDLSTGDGIYKSTDAGRTWVHLGLRDGQQIPQIVVDPKNPDRLFVVVLGHPYGRNEERGVFRSVDGGRTFQKILYKDADTGAVDIAQNPANAQHLYA